MFDGIIEGIQEFVRSMLYGPLSVTLGWLEGMVEVILNEIAGYDFINLPFIIHCYEITIAAALILLPLKLIYEWIWLVLGNDVEKWSSKVLAIGQIALVILVTPPILDLSSTAIKGINEAILSGEIIEGNDSTSTISTGKGFAATVLTATTSLSQEKANDFMNEYDKPSFDINAKDGDNYKYDFDFIMPMIMCLVVFVLILFVGLQMAIRIVSVGFLKIIMPISALSLTNKENPNAFIVNRNALVSNYVMNMVQIFLLVFMFAILGQLSDTASALAKLLFTLALCLSIISLPSVVSAMVGGYNSGIMESLQTMQNVMTTAGSAIRGGKALAGGLAHGASSIGRGAKGAFNKARDLPSKLPESGAKMLGKGMSSAGAVKDRISNIKNSGQQFASNLDKAVKEHGTKAAETLSTNGIKDGTKQLASQAKQSAGRAIGSYASGKANGVKDAVMRQKNLADAQKAFKQAPSMKTFSNDVSSKNNKSDPSMNNMSSPSMNDTSNFKKNDSSTMSRDMKKDMAKDGTNSAINSATRSNDMAKQYKRPYNNMRMNSQNTSKDRFGRK